LAIEDGIEPGFTLEGRIQTGEGMGYARGRSDPLIREPSIGGKRLEQVDNSSEKRNSLSTLGTILRKTCGFQSAHACAMGFPLVLPELFVLAVDVNPIRIHEAERVVSALVRKQATNILVCPGRVAIFCEFKIAEIRPQTMNSPTIRRPSRRIGIPKLSLQKKTPRSFETAKVSDDGAVAARLDVRTRAAGHGLQRKLGGLRIDHEESQAEGRKDARGE